MEYKNRVLRLDIFDYNLNPVCPIYDNDLIIPGQAHDVVIATERNGWRELSFTIPSKLFTDEGEEDNYVLDYVKDNYLIRAVDDIDTYWFIISTPRIVHDLYAKKLEVVCGDICQELKLKQLGLQFSDSEGNNVGTAEELLTTILEGTGWSVGYVYPFLEKRTNEIKRRSLSASDKTGAFKLIAMLCDLFEAKPIYRCRAEDKQLIKTVDIMPINPFSKYEEGHLPDLSQTNGVIELHYGHELKNVSRTINTENIITKLYAYGAYGDKMTGYCNIDICTHDEYVFTLTQDILAGQRYYFESKNIDGDDTVYNFITDTDIASGSTLIYSLMDPASMMYIWDDTNRKAYYVEELELGIILPAELEIKKDMRNWFSFLMDFNYFKESGIFTEDDLQLVAKYQREAPYYYRRINEETSDMADVLTKMAEEIGSVNFCRLDVSSKAHNDGYLQLSLDKSTYEDGVMYRTDYYLDKRSYFKWRAADKLDTNGDPINPATSMLLVIHDTNPITWDKAYLKEIDDEDNPSALTFWARYSSFNYNPETDKTYLFAYNGINGLLGALEASDEAAQKTIETATTVVTEPHPVYYQTTVDNSLITKFAGHAWLWKYDPFGIEDSEFYFCYKQLGDAGWYIVYAQDTEPVSPSALSYWYNWRESAVYKRVVNRWELLDDYEQQKVTTKFGTVYNYCLTRDRYYLGVYENTVYTVDELLPIGNYFIRNAYNQYWAFTIPEPLSVGDTISYNYTDGFTTVTRLGVEQILATKNYRFDNVKYHKYNILGDVTAEQGRLDNNGAIIRVDDEDEDNVSRFNAYVSVVPNTDYVVTSIGEAKIYFYNSKKRFIGSGIVNGSFRSTGETYYIRMVREIPTEDFAEEIANGRIYALHMYDYIIIDNRNYTELSPTTNISGDRNIGLIALMSDFSEHSDLAYIEHYNKVKEAKAALYEYENNITKQLGSILREGSWQDDNYTVGKELDLYLDALETIEKISRPEAEYSIGFVDLYSSNVNNSDYNVGASDIYNIDWPDINISSAVHLVDPDIGINVWGYLDKIEKHYDQPWKSSIKVNSNLTAMNQHSFGDVMSYIANVANESKGKSSLYSATASTSATTNDINILLANIGNNLDLILSNEEVTVRMQDEIAGNYAQLTITVDEIFGEVGNLYGETSRLSIRADGIEAAVVNAVDGLSTRIEQTAQAISGELYNALNGLSNQFEITAKGLSSEIKDSVAALSNQINITAAGLSVKLEDAVNTLANNIELTASGLSARITDEVNGLYSNLTYTAGKLQSSISSVSSTVAQHSTILQTPSSIYAAVKEAVVQNGKTVSSLLTEVSQKAGTWNLAITSGDEAVTQINASSSGVFINASKVKFTSDMTVTGTFNANNWTLANQGLYWSGGLNRECMLDFHSWYDNFKDLNTGTAYVASDAFGLWCGHDKDFVIGVGNKGHLGFRGWTINFMVTHGLNPGEVYGGGRWKSFVRFFGTWENVGDDFDIDIRTYSVIQASIIQDGYYKLSSSRDYKTDIHNLENQGDIIDALNPVSFKYKKDHAMYDNKKRYGLIYEDTVSILPEICSDTTDPEGKHNKGIMYLELVPILLSEVKSLRKRIAALEIDKR